MNRVGMGAGQKKQSSGQKAQNEANGQYKGQAIPPAGCAARHE
jgi:hypothetical protein